jgi:hypothetical protein
VRTANLASAIFRSVWNPVRSETSATSRSRPTSVVGCSAGCWGGSRASSGRELGGQAGGNKLLDPLVPGEGVPHRLRIFFT